VLSCIYRDARLGGKSECMWLKPIADEGYNVYSRQKSVQHYISTTSRVKDVQPMCLRRYEGQDKVKLHAGHGC
jgi:hypothetical protein